MSAEYVSFYPYRCKIDEEICNITSISLAHLKPNPGCANSDSTRMISRFGTRSRDRTTCKTNIPLSFTDGSTWIYTKSITGLEF